jgi:hypothetical protein
MEKDVTIIIIRILRSILWNQLHPMEWQRQLARDAPYKVLAEAQRIIDSISSSSA